MWESGNVMIYGRKYFYEAKVYSLGSRFGIGNGRISQLIVRNDQGDVVIDYVRDWIRKPSKGTPGDKVLQAILARYPEPNQERA